MGKKQHKVSLQHSLAMQWSTFCPSPHGDSPSKKRKFDSGLAGCIPVVWSTDFVWPFTTDVHTEFDLDPQDFAIRLNSTEYWEPALNATTWQPKDSTTRGLESRLQSFEMLVPLHDCAKDSHKPRIGISYDMPSTRLPRDLLRQRILPTGGAAQMLVLPLADRQNGVKWLACAAQEFAPNRVHPRRTKVPMLALSWSFHPLS